MLNYNLKKYSKYLFLSFLMISILKGIFFVKDLLKIGVKNVSSCEIASILGIIAVIFLTIVFWGITKERTWVPILVLFSGFFSLMNRLLLLIGEPFDIKLYFMAPVFTIIVFAMFYYSLKKEYAENNSVRNKERK